MKETILEIKDISVQFENNKEKKRVLDSICLDVKKGEIVSIIGPSGCGKSTLLSAIGGINTNFTGEILVNEKKVTSPSSQRGYIFQKPALFDWLSIVDNVGYGLKLKKMNKEQIKSKSLKFIEEIGLSSYENYYPKQLSGGMQQRVALARVLILEPEILLMDEPFSALDYQTRLEMQKLTLKLWSHYKPSIVFVTHDIEEAIIMSDRVVVMSKNPGLISEIIDIDFKRPRTIDLISSMDFVNIKKRLLEKLI
ncbi:ABC transporter ATP-binding protein [Clostridioides mangenotii]|uniref:ABC transporter ATP-binding protein n=1 Tax=Metaclostridioides mangenotii TaxID=1540 RepID=UPI001C0FF5AD|nr:ABC transporter ATP-binding protein [Clostridioides mangenotii]MBU5308358.1 ABC transporter ATP-binding protein [Clostridioides mangenotii]